MPWINNREDQQYHSFYFRFDFVGRETCLASFLRIYKCRMNRIVDDLIITMSKDIELSDEKLQHKEKEL